MNEGLKVIPFWESISPFFEKVGASLQGITNAFGYLVNGDMDGATVALAQAGAAAGLVDQKTAADLVKAYNTKKYGDPVSANIAEDKILKQAQEWLTPAAEFAAGGFTGADIDYKDSPLYRFGFWLAEQNAEKDPSSAHVSEASGRYAGGGGRRRPADEYEYTGYIPANSDSTLADYEAAKGRRSVQTGELTEQVSASGVYDAVTAALRNAPISGTVQVTTNLELDGETLGTKMQEFSADQIRRGNGR